MPVSMDRVLTPRRGAVVAPVAALGEFSTAVMHGARDAVVLVTEVAAFEAAASPPFEFVVVDGALPAAEALAAVRAARAGSSLALVVVVTNAGASSAPWLAAGADAVLPHPLVREELDALFEAFARRGRAFVERLRERVAKPWRLHRAAETLDAPSGVAVKLSPAETLLLSALAEKHGVAITRNELARAANILEDGKRNVDAAMYRLRKRIEAATGELSPVRSVHGQGYVIATPFELVAER